MLSAPFSLSLHLLLGSTPNDEATDAGTQPQYHGTTELQGPPDPDIKDLETLSFQICTAIAALDYAHAVWKQISPNFRHYAHDNGCFAGFNNTNGFTLQEILLSRERYDGPEHFTKYLGSHCVKMQTTVDEKSRAVSIAEIFVFFYAGGIPNGKTSEGVTVFTWVKKSNQWMCVKSATLRHCWTVDYCLAIGSDSPTSI